MFGTLWYDPTQKPLREKLHDAALVFIERMGQIADYAEVNPKAIEADQTIDGIEVHRSKTILPNCLLVGRRLS